MESRGEAMMDKKRTDVEKKWGATTKMADLSVHRKTPSGQRADLGTGRSCGSLAKDFTKDFYDLSKIDAGWLTLKQRDFNVADQVADALGAHVLLAQKRGLGLSYDVLPDVPKRVTGDPDRLRQILVHLVSNAINATSQGEIRVCVERESDRGDRVCLGFSVSDTGMGIRPERQALVLEPLVHRDGSGTRRYGSTGLGLLLSRRLVEMMGGRLQLESDVGKGTTVRFTTCFEPHRNYS
jgi:signal transduction histidine kinase